MVCESWVSEGGHCSYWGQTGIEHGQFWGAVDLGLRKPSLWWGEGPHMHECPPQEKHGFPGSPHSIQGALLDFLRFIFIQFCLDRSVGGME